MNDWIVTQNEDGFIEENKPTRDGWIEAKLVWFDNPTKVLIEKIWYTKEEGFRANEYTDLSYNWNVAAWRDIPE